MKFTTETLAQSLADYLAPYFPGVNFYADPNQQGTKLPCLFLQNRGGETKLRQAGRWLRIIRLDLVYLLEYNLPDLHSQYTAAAETLDEIMELFPYVCEEQSTLLRTYNRTYKIEADALHYKFDLQVWVVKPTLEAAMQELTTNLEVIEYGEKNGKKHGEK
jgi:hypothetical protein